MVSGDGMSRKNMPLSIYRSKDFHPSLLDQWAEDIIREFDEYNKVMITTDHEAHDDAELPKRIRTTIGQLIQKILPRIDIKNLYIEGGATTYEILRNLDIQTLYPVSELAPGNIRMLVDRYPGLCLITKPGSYKWPDYV
jgi:uncharacterized protein YgbK (DUF1537 family)